MEKEALPLGVMLARMKREMFRVLRKRTDESGELKLSHEQFGLLFAINRHEAEVVQQDMANLFGKNKSSILRLIDSLEEKDLVHRIIDPKDRRKKSLVVTEAGNRVMKHYLKIEFSLLKELQSGLLPSEMDTFYKVIDTIENNARKL